MLSVKYILVGYCTLNILSCLLKAFKYIFLLNIYVQINRPDTRNLKWITIKHKEVLGNLF